MNNTTTLKTSRPFQFERYGRTYQLAIDDVEGLKHVLELDEAHWVATNAPIETINADPVFLQLLDTNADGRIQTAEVKEGIRWLLGLLLNTDGIQPGSTTLDIESVSRETPVGRRIYNSAMKMFKRSKGAEIPQITFEEVRLIKKEEEGGGKDRPGLVLPAAAPDAEVRVFLEDIIATVGGEPHPGGSLGVTLERLEQFQQENHEYQNWLKQADIFEEHPSSPIMPFGKETPELYDVFSTLREKIHQYFALCSAVKVSPMIMERVRQMDSQLQDQDFPDSRAVLSFLASAPLAAPSADGLLNFTTDINPYYVDELEAFRTRLLPRVLECVPESLSLEQWRMVRQQFEPYQNWLDAKPVVHVDTLSQDKLRQYDEHVHNLTTARRLLQESYKIAFDLGNIRLVEQLILYQAYLLPFVNSFVSFPHLYDPSDRALFEMGTLIMDGRHFTLSMRVPNREQHINFIKASNMFVLYVEISEQENTTLYEVAVPVTSGMRGNLQLNKRGIFHDIHGHSLHAKVIHIVENPISFFEAISAPFRRLGNAITSKLDELSAKAQEQLEVMSTQAITNVSTHPPKLTLKAPPTARTAATAGGLLAGGSIAIAALSSSFAYITKTFAGLTWSMIFGGLLAAVGAVMFPTVIVAWLKLSKRDLSTILEGSGWGINARMKLTRKQAHTFTFRPSYPLNSKGIFRHKYWWLLAALTAILAVVWYSISS